MLKSKEKHPKTVPHRNPMRKRPRSPHPAAAGKRVSRYPICKRIFDILFSASSLLLLAPVFFAIAFALRLSSRGPILFRQVRMGRGMEPFLLYKFRTMSVRAPRDRATAALPDPERYITRVGAFLRKTSLDELPQLYNILRGDMSFLGPRPVVLSEVSLIIRRALTGAYRIRPGLSGAAQVYGRDLLSDAEKAAYDAHYAANLSFFYDLTLLLSTVSAVLLRRHIREGGREEASL